MSAGQGSYYHDIQAECENPQWTALDWQTSTPAGAAVTFTAQTSARRDKLGESAIVSLARVPGQQAPINISGRLTADNVQSRQFLRIRAALKTGEDGESPVLSTFTVRWNCD